MITLKNLSSDLSELTLKVENDPVTVEVKLPTGLSELFDPVVVKSGDNSNVLWLPKNEAKTEAMSTLISGLMFPANGEILLWDNVNQSLNAPTNQTEHLIPQAMLLDVMIPIADPQTLVHRDSCAASDQGSSVQRGAPHGCVGANNKFMGKSAVYLREGTKTVRLSKTIASTTSALKTYEFEEVVAHYLVPALIPNGATCWIAFAEKGAAEDFIQLMDMTRENWMEVGSVVWSEKLQSLIAYFQPEHN
jgi:hypothetical protein